MNKTKEGNYYKELFNKGCKCLKMANRTNDEKLRTYYLKAAEGFFMKAREACKAFHCHIKTLSKDLRCIAQRFNTDGRFNPEIIGFIHYSDNKKLAVLANRVITDFYVANAGGPNE